MNKSRTPFLLSASLVPCSRKIWKKIRRIPRLKGVRIVYGTIFVKVRAMSAVILLMMSMAPVHATVRICDDPGGPVGHYLHDTGKSPFVWDCVVGLRGLELRANHAVAIEPVSGP
jgi:hypothetical protein